VDSDVLVVGNGPAGLAVAASCADAGLRVSVVGLDHDAPWPNTYGIWEDELEPLGVTDVLAARWPEVTVAPGVGPVRTLDRPYGRIDNDRLQSRLLFRCARSAARFVKGRAVGVETGGRAPIVSLEDGTRRSARAVVDASGHRPVLLTPGDARPPAWQAAYGILGTFSGAPPVPPGSMVFMDYRDEPFAGLPGVRRDPTFLYGMDLGHGRWFVEETSLARRPALDAETLRTRLLRRLAAAGAHLEETLEVERCLFPMGVPLPPMDQLVIGFGGAAGMVHPATGYQVGSALRRAPALAAALAAALDVHGASAASVAAAGWAAVWPPDLLRQRALHLFGLEALLRFDTPTTQRFFSAFFALGEDHWRGFVSGAPSVSDLAGTMLALYRRAPGSLRRCLVRPALGRDGLALARALR
jgi:lycopene beta-cyclase